jgi:hypothetical protein
MGINMMHATPRPDPESAMNCIFAKHGFKRIIRGYYITGRKLSQIITQGWVHDIGVGIDKSFLFLLLLLYIIYN